MKITKERLRQVIKEELKAVLKESDNQVDRFDQERFKKIFDGLKAGKYFVKYIHTDTLESLVKLYSSGANLDFLNDDGNLEQTIDEFKAELGRRGVEQKSDHEKWREKMFDDEQEYRLSYKTSPRDRD